VLRFHRRGVGSHRRVKVRSRWLTGRLVLLTVLVVAPVLASFLGGSPMVNVDERNAVRSAQIGISSVTGPGLSVVASAAPSTVLKVGEVIDYSYQVTNVGDIALDQVAVVDTPIAPAGPLTSGPTCPAGTLAPGTGETCTGAYTVTQTDLDNGAINRSARAIGKTAAAGSEVQLDRTGWIATSNTTSAPRDAPQDAIESTAGAPFSSDADQAVGMYFEVDIASTQTFNHIEMDSGGHTSDYARSYAIQVSTDGSSFATVYAATGTSSPEVATFPQQSARYVRALLTAGASTDWWSIVNFNVFRATEPPRGTPVTSTYSAIEVPAAVAISLAPPGAINALTASVHLTNTQAAAGAATAARRGSGRFLLDGA